MPMIGSGTLQLGYNTRGNGAVVNVIGWYYATQSFNLGSPYAYYNVGLNNFGAFAGRLAYNASGAITFPTTNLRMSYFYGSSPANEWACACTACDCVGTG